MDLPQHSEGCGSRTDFCELCNRRVMLRDMAEHKENKCDQGVVDETIDITGFADNQAPGAFFPPPYNMASLFGHAHPDMPLFPQQHPAAAYEGPSSPAHREDSMQVDPQWLASVAGVCGEENLDQVLAQNLMVQGSYSAAASRSDAQKYRNGGEYVKTLC